jgi:hypothetical protein
MSTTLGIFTYPGGNAALARHWPYFLGQGADYNVVITTTEICEVPEDVRTLVVGDNRYIEGPHLPNRLLDTMATLLLRPWSELILCEYDTVFFRPIDLAQLWTVASYRAGSQTFGSKALSFYHNPWVFTRPVAIAFLARGREEIKNGLCPDRGRGQPSTPECSPDVFFGAICESLQVPVQSLWYEYSRNDLDRPDYLDEARQAYRNGAQVIHGIKTKEQLNFIMS